MSVWEILTPALLFSFLLVAMHTYFGLHVLARGIIFIDLALAQFAALGASLAFLFGENTHGLLAQGSAFAVALAAATAFAWLRRVSSKTIREVIIGTAYVGATAVSILVLSRSVQGMEELKAIFNGDVLWVGWTEIIVTAALYAVLAGFHFIFRRRFHSLSFGDADEAKGVFFMGSCLLRFLCRCHYACRERGGNTSGVCIFDHAGLCGFSLGILIYSPPLRGLGLWHAGQPVGTFPSLSGRPSRRCHNGCGFVFVVAGRRDSGWKEGTGITLVPPFVPASAGATSKDVA